MIVGSWMNISVWLDRYVTCMDKFRDNCSFVLTFISLACFASITTAQEPLVTIEGGADQTGTMYQWTVTNHHTSPIVYVEFPHYRANIFFAPDGWSTNESTNLVGIGVTQQHGKCIAKINADEDGIVSNQQAIFSMKVWNDQVRRIKGTAYVKFYDQRVVSVKDVELPAPLALSDQYISLIGLGTIFLLWIVFQIVKSLKNKSQDSHIQAQP